LLKEDGVKLIKRYCFTLFLHNSNMYTTT